MDIDEDDDFYAPEEAEAPAPAVKQPETATKVEEVPTADLEEGEEEDGGGAMDEDDDSVSFMSRAPGPCAHLLLGYRYHH
jgi:pre-mRNA 3'-end-processing factor FIP1